MKIKYVFLALYGTLSFSMNAQSGFNLTGGLSLAYTDNPATSGKGKMISGFNVSLTGRFGSNNWYIRPGIELHNLQLLPEEKVDPFSDQASMYMMKFPAQIGLRIIKTENFALRVAGGIQFSYTVSIQKNALNFNHNTISDTQFGSLIGAGIDLGPITIDVNFEKGLTELYTKTGYKADYFFINAGFLF